MRGNVGARLTHRDTALVAHNGDDRVVTAWATCRGVNDDEDGLVQNDRQARRVEGQRYVHLAEHLLQTVEGQASKLALNQVGPVLHNDFEFAMPLGGLPRRHQMQHVHARLRLAGILARLARQLDGAGHKQRPVSGRVNHFDESGLCTKK